MLQLRKSSERGQTQNAWLDSLHTFSFDQYFDPKHNSFRTLRVINQDIIASGQGFGMHPHHDMEIITYVMRGAVTHEDSLGNKTKITPGEIQCMSAGTGVTHSEYNASQTEPLELLQIWVFPNAKHLKPSYQQTRYENKKNVLELLISPNGEKNSLTIHQDVKLYRAVLEPKKSIEYEISKKRGVWIQMVSGSVNVNQKVLHPGDGLAVENEKTLKIMAESPSEFLLFDL